MSNIVIGKSGEKNVSIDLKTLVRTHLLIWASTGGGKSFLIRRLAEQIFGKLPVIIVDREGEFSTLREQYGFVLVGPNGETPADPRSAKIVAERLLEMRASAVCDLFELTHEARGEWVKNFYGALVNAPKRLWSEAVICLDEAHTFAPEKGMGESAAYQNVTDFSGVARKRGMACVFATQRLSKLSKNATAEMYNQAAGPTAQQSDRERAAYEMGVGKSSPEGKELSESLRVLEPGNFFFQGRAVSMDRLLVKVGPVETSHGSALTGKHAIKSPPTPDEVKKMLPKLADLPKQAEEKARTEAELKAEIRSLKTQIRAQIPATDPKLAERVKELEKIVSELTKYAGRCENFIADQATAMGRAIHGLEAMCKIQPPDPELKNVAKIIQKHVPQGVSFVNAKPWTPKPVPQVEMNGNKLRSGAERMLAALATWAPNGMTEGQMRAHAGLKKSGTFSAYLSDLRKGYIEERDGLVFATQTGLDYCQHIPPAPQTTEEVLAIWNPKLRDGARRMLNALVDVRGKAITKEELGEIAQLQKSGTFSAYLSDLKTARLAVVNRDGTVAANAETLFL